MDILQSLPVQCPCCGESIEILIDTSIGDQEYIEDCQVCCEPLVMTISCSDTKKVHIDARPENA